MNTTLFVKRAFWPIFGVQFLGAFNDNVFKSALVMLITFKLSSSAENISMLTTLAAGMFILPFFTFSALAGNIADQFEKTQLIRWVKLAEIGIMLLGGWAVIQQSLIGIFTLLFLMGVQSAFFGPLKYSILPELLKKETELTAANGWFSASTFMAILLGTLIGGWLVLNQNGTLWLAGLVIFCAVLGYGFSWLVPLAHARPHPQKTPFKPLFLTQQEVIAGRQHKRAFMAVMAISWFWFLGAAYLSQIPVMVKASLMGGESIVLLFLATFSIGIGVGAWVINKLIPKFKNLSALKYHSVMLASISVLILLSHIGIALSNQPDTLKTLSDYLQDLPSVFVLICLFFIAVLGGAYIVPLYTHLQVHSPEYFRGRMIAVNNIMNAFMMVLSSLFFMLGYRLQLDLSTLFYLLAALNIGFAIWLKARILQLETFARVGCEIKMR